MPLYANVSHFRVSQIAKKMTIHNRPAANTGSNRKVD
jgi:hypothetical protein